MTYLTLAIATAIVLASAMPAHGSANVVKAPTGLRQSYADGTTTELLCAERSPELSKCTFQVSGPGGTDSYALSAGDFRLDLYLYRYSYWPGGSRGDFVFSIPIACPSKELERLPALQRDFAECHLFMSPLEGKLVPDRVKVSVLGGNGSAAWGPNSSFKPKPLRGSA